MRHLPMFLHQHFLKQDNVQSPELVLFQYDLYLLVVVQTHIPTGHRQPSNVRDQPHICQVKHLFDPAACK